MAEWKLIKDFPNYEVSDDGRVRSLGRFVRNTKSGSKRWVEPRERKLQPHSGGYLQVRLYSDNRGANCYVHILVADAFIPNPDGLSDVNHKHFDGDKTRNLVDNLEWMTRKENIHHSKDILIGRAPIGTRHGMAKLSEADVVEIRRARLPRKVLASHFGVCRGTIDLIITRKIWRHLGA